MLGLVGLTAARRRRVGGYSLGMRQRLGIAGALLAEPPVLMFDEPANGLDPEGIRWMRDLLRAHAGRRRDRPAVEPPARRGEHTVDRLLVIGKGRLVADGPSPSCWPGTGRPSGRWSRYVRPRPGRRGFDVQHRADGVLVVPGTDPSQVGAVAAAGGHVLVELRQQQRALEDLFFSLTTAA